MAKKSQPSGGSGGSGLGSKKTLTPTPMGFPDGSRPNGSGGSSSGAAARGGDLPKASMAAAKPASTPEMGGGMGQSRPSAMAPRPRTGSATAAEAPRPRSGMAPMPSLQPVRSTPSPAPTPVRSMAMAPRLGPSPNSDPDGGPTRRIGSRDAVRDIVAASRAPSPRPAQGNSIRMSPDGQVQTASVTWQGRSQDGRGGVPAGLTSLPSRDYLSKKDQQLDPDGQPFMDSAATQRDLRQRLSSAQGTMRLPTIIGVRERADTLRAKAEVSGQMSDYMRHQGYFKPESQKYADNVASNDAVNVAMTVGGGPTNPRGGRRGMSLAPAAQATVPYRPMAASTGGGLPSPPRITATRAPQTASFASPPPLAAPRPLAAPTPSTPAPRPTSNLSHGLQPPGAYDYSNAPRPVVAAAPAPVKQGPRRVSTGMMPVGGNAASASEAQWDKFGMMITPSMREPTRTGGTPWEAHQPQEPTRLGGTPNTGPRLSPPTPTAQIPTRMGGTPNLGPRAPAMAPMPPMPPMRPSRTPETAYPTQVSGNGYGDAPVRQYPVDSRLPMPMDMASLDNRGAGADMIASARDFVPEQPVRMGVDRAAPMASAQPSRPYTPPNLGDIAPPEPDFRPPNHNTYLATTRPMPRPPGKTSTTLMSEYGEFGPGKARYANAYPKLPPALAAAVRNEPQQPGLESIQRPAYDYGDYGDNWPAGQPAPTRLAMAPSAQLASAYSQGGPTRPALSQGTLTPAEQEIALAEEGDDGSNDPIFTDPNGAGMRSGLGGPPEQQIPPRYVGERRQIMGSNEPQDLDALMQGGSEPESMIPASATSGLFGAVNNPFSEMIAYANSARLTGGTGGIPVEPNYSFGGGGGSSGSSSVDDEGDWIEEDYPEQDFGGGIKYKRAGKRRRRRGSSGGDSGSFASTSSSNSYRRTT